MINNILFVLLAYVIGAICKHKKSFLPLLPFKKNSVFGAKLTLSEYPQSSPDRQEQVDVFWR